MTMSEISEIFREANIRNQLLEGLKTCDPVMVENALECDLPDMTVDGYGLYDADEIHLIEHFYKLNPYFCDIIAMLIDDYRTLADERYLMAARYGYIEKLQDLAYSDEWFIDDQYITSCFSEACCYDQRACVELLLDQFRPQITEDVFIEMVKYTNDNNTEIYNLLLDYYYPQNIPIR